MKKLVKRFMAALLVLGAVSCSKDAQPSKINYGADGVTPLPEAVDVGMVLTRDDGSKYKLLWASFNLGASRVYEIGDYFAWGETEPHYSSLYPLVWKEGMEKGYDWSCYRHAEGASDKLTKYCNDTKLGLNGYSDKYETLLPEDDVAHVKLGGKWRMPTRDEISNLQTLSNHKDRYATDSWAMVMDENGHIAKDKEGKIIYGYQFVDMTTGNSLFFPSGSHFFGTERSYEKGMLSPGHYWTSSIITAEYKHGTNASNMIYYPDMVGWGSSWTDRCHGLLVRPVCEEDL